jgi:molecular chaperone HtpG
VERSPDLLPRYLRFLSGVVDSPDLPLNVSREMLQHDRQIRQIRKALVKKVLDSLADLKEKDQEKYLALWKAFGRVLKEGPSEDHENKEKIAELILFQSSHHEEKPSPLADYVSRMKEGQEAIYYLTGASRPAIESSPHLEALRVKGIEVLYLTDAVDELVVESLAEYQGKKLKSAGKGTVDLGTAEEKEEKKKELDEKTRAYQGLLEWIQKALDDRIKEVRLSARLTASPACLVGAEHDFSPRLEQLLKRDTDRPRQRRILELNPDHEIVKRLERMVESDAASEKAGEYAELLYGYAVLAEGSELPDPAAFARRIADLMSRGLA